MSEHDGEGTPRCGEDSIPGVDQLAADAALLLLGRDGDRPERRPSIGPIVAGL